MFNICIHHILFELCLAKKKEKEKMNKIETFMFGFLDLVKGCRTYKVNLALEQLWDVVHKVFALLCFIFLGAAPIPYVQEAILNLPHP